MKKSYFRAGEDLRFKMITLAEEQELFERTRDGDVEARDFLVINHRLFVMNHARACGRRYAFLDDDEIVSCGIQALMDTIDTFDFSQGKRWTALLRPHIRGLVRRLWESKKAVKTPNQCESVPLSACVGSSIPSVQHDFEATDFADYTADAIKRALFRLSSAHRDIVQSVFFKDESMKDIAKRRKVTRQAIHSACQTALGKLREFLAQEGLEAA
jgi:RNA polymerase sigma factor (sigma-70 family)